MEEKRICFECGCIIEENEGYYVDSKQEYICDDCYCDNYITCEGCGEVTHIDNSVYHNDVMYCQSCFDDNFVRCACCDEYVANSETYETSNGDVCELCYDVKYEECHECGDIFRRDDMYYSENDGCYYCEDCEPNEVIENYGYKPEPIFSGNSNLYLGVELEIDAGGQNHDNAQRIIDINNLLYCKYDGSLNNGFEIVSHPADLEYHINNMSWDNVLQECKKMGYTSHDAETCGLHIHVSKKALGADEHEREKNIQNILWFIENNWDKMLVFSRRTQNQLDRWASRYGLLDGEKPADILKKAKSGCGRYKAINLQNYNTIEFRLYRGTLNATTFYATLQFTNYICEFCKAVDDIMFFTWGDFLQYVEENASYNNELFEYLNIRGIK